MARISKAFVLLIILAVGLVSRAPASGSACDINQDGLMNVVDVETIINEALNRAPATHDLNRDGYVDIVDVQIEITAALGVACLAATGPQTHTIGSVSVSVENTTSVVPTGQMTIVAAGPPVSVENSTSVEPTGPMTFVVDGAPVSIENSVSIAPTGPMTFAVAGAPVSIENSVSVAPSSPQTHYTSGLFFSLFNGILPSSLQSTGLAPSLRFLRPISPEFIAEALARGAERIDGKPVCLDSDGDGLCDEDELIIGTSPYMADTDGDGYPDGLELALGSDPLDPKSIPDIHGPGYLATPPASIQNTIPDATLPRSRQGAIYAANNQ